MSATLAFTPRASESGSSHPGSSGLDDIHLDPEEMDRLLHLDCPHELAFEWLAHFVACRLCRRRLSRRCPEESRRILDRFLLLSDTRQESVRIHPNAYDRVFERIRVRALLSCRSSS